MGAAAVAILLFQVDQERNFIHDDNLPALSSQLIARGVPSEIFEATLPAIDADDADDLSVLDALAERVRGRFGLCVYTRLWSASIFRRLRALLPGIAWVYVGDRRVAFEGTEYALDLGQVDTLAAIARAVGAGEPVDPEAFCLPPTEVGAAAHHDANLVRITVGRRPARPAVVHGSPGCAYSADVRENPLFQGVPFPASQVVLKGCSFCASGGVGRLPAGETLRSVLMQVDNVLATQPDVAEIQVNDQNPFPYLVQFVERVGERTRRPVSILIETRADWFLGALPVMERALQTAARFGHRILLFLVGIESLSQRELDLYNKGVTVAQNERAVLECRRLRERYPGVYSADRAAFGFILYNPWTELRDIALNIEAAERIGMQEFRGQMSRAKLRLYPNTALFYKAQHEGLLAPRFPYEAMDSARRYGYEAEVPWRFKHLATDRAYGVHDAIHRAVGKHEELKMLYEVVRFLARNPGRHHEPVSALARDVVRAMGSRFQREIRHEAPRAASPVSSSQPVSPSRAPDWAAVTSLARDARSPEDVLRAAGLYAGAALPPPRRPPPDPDARAVPRLELMAFEAGLKPALYLTLPRAEAAALLPRFAGYAVARVDYDLDHDAVTDVRRRVNAPEGEGSHVDLFVARDPAAVAQAREIYLDPRGPSARLAEMGAMLGYPPCCVAAFAALDDRSNNSAIRYAAHARTQRERFAPELNNLAAHVLPWFPCSYGCVPSIAAARAVLDLFAARDPDGAAALRRRLTRSTLYVDHARALSLGGARLEGDVLRYDAVYGAGAPAEGDAAEVAARFEGALGAVLSLGDGLRVGDGRLEVFAAGRVALALDRGPPWLSRVFPFASE
jgi:hypothetical protein